MNMQAVKLDCYTLCKGLDSFQGDKKKRKESFISFVSIMQNLAITGWSIYLKNTIRWTKRNKFKKKYESKKNAACLRIVMEKSIKTANEGAEKEISYHRKKEEFEVCDIVNDKC